MNCAAESPPLPSGLTIFDSPLVAIPPTPSGPSLLAKVFGISPAEFVDNSNPAVNCPARFTVKVFGSPESKIEWDGYVYRRGGTNVIARSVLTQDGSQVESPTGNTRLVNCTQINKLTWQQRTNQCSEILVSSNLTTWESLRHVRYTNNVSFVEADPVESGTRFYRLQLVTP